MVFLRVHRRATSVPVGGPSVSDEPDLLASKDSYLFSRAAIDNADALSTASKRNDQQFISDVNARIGSAHFSQPVVRPIKKAYVSARGGGGGGGGGGPASPFVSRRSSIAVSSASRSPLVTDSPVDDDVDYQVKLIAPLTSRLTRYGGGGGGRAASVPPLAVGTVIYGGGYSDYPGGHLVHHAPHAYDLEITKHVEEPVPTFQKLNPVADLAVRQAHRNLDRIEREIQSSGDVIVSRPIAPRTVLYTASTDGPWRRSLSYHGPRTPSYASSSVKVRSPSPVGRRYVHTSYAKSPAPGIGDDDLFDYLPPVKYDRSVKLVGGEKPALYSTRILPPLPPPSSRRSTGHTDPLHYDLHLTSPRGYSGAPVTASSSISQKVSSGSTPHHLIHSSTDHSLPLHVLTTPYRASSTPLSNPPTVPITLKPLPSVPSGLPPISRPQLSDTRRKVRDVLCKVKGDPNYFD